MLPIRNILYPTDFSESARPAFELACALARDYRAALVVIHVAPQTRGFAPEGIVIPIPVEESYELHTCLVRFNPVDPSVEVEYHVLEGDASDQILKAAQDAKADLIVMGTHGKSGFTRLLMGSVAESVLRHAPCPVLTVRGPFHLPLDRALAGERHQQPTGTA